MSITPSVSDSYAEYLRIQLARTKNESEVTRLRAELSQLEKALLAKHKGLLRKERMK